MALVSGIGHVAFEFVFKIRKVVSKLLAVGVGIMSRHIEVNHSTPKHILTIIGDKGLRFRIDYVN